MKLLIAGLKDKTKNYEKAFKKLGAKTAVSLLPEALNDVDGILIPGGGDISPHFWGEELDGSDEPDLELDKAQFVILKEAVKREIPVFGICRGHQLINVYFGGSLYQDIETKELHIQHNNIDSSHEVFYKGESYISKLYGESFFVNSAHHQAISVLGRDLFPVLYSRDGIIEAICHRNKKIYGVQFHPERMCFEYSREDTVDGSRLLEFFIEKCEGL